MAGLDVVLVNDRTDHSRNQILVLPEAWSVQMMVLLGIQAKSIDILENSGNDCCLISLVESMKKFGEKSLSLKNSFLAAIYNAPVCPIENPEKLACEPHRQLETFDVLVCAGGANDHNCRDPYLGIAHQVTAPKVYSVVVFKKSSQYTKKLLTLENQKSFFLAENDPWLKRVLTRYNLFTMLENAPQGFSWNKPYLASDETLLINIAGRDVITTENHQTFYVTTETPTLILDVLEELDRLIQKDNVMTNAKEEDVKAFKLRFQRKWFAILATVALIKLSHKLDKAFDGGKVIYVNIDDKGNIGEHEDALLSFDPHPVNMNIFPLVQTEVNTPAKMYEVPIKHTGISRASRKATSTLRFIVFNTGDSLASSHYYSGKGVFYGRRASDSAANEILKYNQSFQKGKDNIKDRNTSLVTALNTDLNGVKTQIIDSGSQYVDPILKDQKNEISRKLLLELVNAEKAKGAQNSSKPLGEFEYRVESSKDTSSNANKFTVRMSNGNSLEGEVKEGSLKIGNIKYETFIEAVISRPIAVKV
ncbi:hypothetical protein DdX_20647 [Ditylenchus destructor]|uniref:Uncharacterized protein n=1 Tax=Ditylenchus destructor TaxID=166010 RepID=A0AAD4MGX8_9BILA|nr:hypothetical protein DdX_20647 [Ditylenchus destructor]